MLSRRRGLQLWPTEWTTSLLDAFRQQMEIRKSLMELENNNMEIQIATSNNLLTITDRRRRKWRVERRKESVNKDESEKDSDSSESPPDTTETQEVAIARENLVALMAEQKKIHKEKALLERRFLELQDQARRLEELLPQRVSSEEQREVLGLLCKVHELECWRGRYLKPRRAQLRGFALWTAHQTLISTLMVNPRPLCYAPSTEGSLLSPKSGLPTAASKQAQMLSPLQPI
ncbi:kinesin-like protein KIF19 isoform X2 [Oreochromis niloticus]|uniref:kinesin-like protein KIF19 isoform X2 n=1 Tax=Oreochromis niloticus TaxID=8128 RepID=UPI000DF40758|nr:kinesin-like protein KIF19 isoform X2 [Oreochromis niloticus]XP_025765346.1 kinesin-like protein KIF19 isoform X2 [Oreochromis niloticus]